LRIFAVACERQLQHGNELCWDLIHRQKNKILKSHFPVCFDIGSIETIVEKHLRPHSQMSKQGEQQQQAEHTPRATSQHEHQRQAEHKPFPVVYSLRIQVV
jgi:hypothetical protein